MSRQAHPASRGGSAFQLRGSSRGRTRPCGGSPPRRRPRRETPRARRPRLGCRHPRSARRSGGRPLSSRRRPSRRTPRPRAARPGASSRRPFRRQARSCTLSSSRHHYTLSPRFCHQGLVRNRRKARQLSRPFQSRRTCTSSTIRPGRVPSGPALLRLRTHSTTSMWFSRPRQSRASPAPRQVRFRRSPPSPSRRTLLPARACAQPRTPSPASSSRRVSRAHAGRRSHRRPPSSRPRPRASRPRSCGASRRASRAW